MKRKHLLLAAAVAAGTTLAMAKMPAPSDEAKTKAGEAAAKAAHGNKLANFQLCQSMDKVAAAYYADAKKVGKDTKPATATPACDNPGPFVYAPPVPASGAAPLVAAAAPAAPGPAKAAGPATAAAPAAPAKK